jgi:hypothetical protein
LLCCGILIHAIISKTASVKYKLSAQFPSSRETQIGDTIILWKESYYDFEIIPEHNYQELCYGKWRDRQPRQLSQKQVSDMQGEKI